MARMFLSDFGESFQQEFGLLDVVHLSDIKNDRSGVLYPKIATELVSSPFETFRRICEKVVVYTIRREVKTVCLGAVKLIIAAILSTDIREPIHGVEQAADHR